MDAKTLARKVEVTVTDVTVMLRHASQVYGRQRTVYYKAAVIFMASILELVLWEYIEANCKKNPKLLKSPKWRYEPVQPLVKGKLGTTKTLYIAERFKDMDSLEKVRDDFNSMNRFCRDRKLISKALYDKLEFARNKRNDIHLQKTTHAHRNYTRNMVLRVAKTTSVMMKKRLAV